MEKELKNVEEVNAIELYFKYCSRDNFFDKLSYFNPEWISLILMAIPLVLERASKSGYTNEMLKDTREKMNALIEFLVTISHNRNEIDSMGNEVYQIRKILEF
jgi:hypothetical protein